LLEFDSRLKHFQTVIYNLSQGLKILARGYLQDSS